MIGSAFVETILRRHRLWSNLQPDVKMLPVYDEAGKALTAVEEHKLLVASTMTGGARHGPDSHPRLPRFAQ